MIEHRTPYGTVSVLSEAVAVSATEDQLYAWSHRTGAQWPCSTLEDLDHIEATFDATGLIDLEEPEGADIDGNEFSAWSADIIREAITEEHPCWFVTVGQFA